MGTSRGGDPVQHGAVKLYQAPFFLGVHGDTSKEAIAVAFLPNGEAQVVFADGTQVRQAARERWAP